MEIDRLIDSIVNKLEDLSFDNSDHLDLNTNNNNAKNVIMTTPNPSVTTPNFSLLKYQVENIPHFDGNKRQLNRFLISCEHLLKNFQNTNNLADPINTCLIDSILNKLSGRAADLICSRTELTNWNDIKNTLILTFSDQRGIDCLIQELINLKPYKNESSLQFGIRIQDTRSLLFAKLSSTIQNAQEKIIKITHYDDFALKTFINGLPYNLQLVVRLKNPTSLEQAMSFVTEEENFRQYSHNSQHINKPQFKPDLQTNQRNPNSINSPNYSNRQTHPFVNYNIPQFNRGNNFAQMIPQNSFKPNVFQNNFKPHNNMSQNQNPRNFGTAQNVRPPHIIKPFPNYVGQNWYQQNRFNTPNQNQSTVSKNSRYPQPMDISSGNSRINTRPPKFTFEELHNQEIQSEEDIPNPYPDYDQFYDQNYPNYEEYFEQPDIPNCYPNTEETNIQNNENPISSPNTNTQNFIGTSITTDQT